MFRENSQIGPYILIRRLGRGGFGEVWLAERRTKFVTTKVAVKLPLQDQIDTEKIKQEATLWEQASGHPNILPIIDADEYDGQIVIVSEFAPDGSLEQSLKQTGPMTAGQAIYFTIDILSGLEFLHSRQIVHRDLKPANILLQGETPRLSDFGISRALRTTVSSESKNVSGTFAYMAPEAFDGKRSVQTDIWSVGVNLYRFLTGSFPYPQKEPTALIAAIMMQKPAALPDSVPPELRRIIAKAMAKKPEDRYLSAEDMREDLRSLAFTKFDRRSKPRGKGPNVVPIGRDDISSETVARNAGSIDSGEESENKNSSRKMVFAVAGTLLLFLGVFAVLYLSSGKLSNSNGNNALTDQAPVPANGQAANLPADTAVAVPAAHETVNSVTGAKEIITPENASEKTFEKTPEKTAEAPVDKTGNPINTGPPVNSGISPPVTPQTPAELPVKPDPGNRDLSDPYIYNRPANAKRNDPNKPYVFTRPANTNKKP